MTKIGVLSDTHVFDSGRRQVPTAVFELFKQEGVSRILHGGDIVAWSLIEALEAIAPVSVVRGNNDPGSYGLPNSLRLQIEGVTIGLAHGDVAIGSPKPIKGIKGNGSTAANALSHFADEPIDCCVFGHSHNPLSHVIELAGREVLLFNPGSPTDRRYSPHFGCGILTVEGDKLSAKLVVWT
jgi:putative phosphoesterase